MREGGRERVVEGVVEGGREWREGERAEGGREKVVEKDGLPVLPHQ